MLGSHYHMYHILNQLVLMDSVSAGKYLASFHLQTVEKVVIVFSHHQSCSLGKKGMIYEGDTSTFIVIVHVRNFYIIGNGNRKEIDIEIDHGSSSSRSS